MPDARVLRLMVLLAAAPHIGQPQSPAEPVKPQDRDLRLFGKYELQVAEKFESLRSESGEPGLTRVIHREELDQLVCTAAVTDKNPWQNNGSAALMYETADAALVTPELKSIARYRNRHTPPFRRYAIAIFPGVDKETGQRVFWVGIQLYWSAFNEFIEHTFTDSRPYRNNWKKLIAPECGRVE